MDIDWTLVGRLIASSVPVLLAAILGFVRGPGVPRTRVSHDADLLAKLPESSAAHRTLSSHINSQLERIVVLDDQGKRDWSGAVIAAVLIAGFLAAALWLWQQATWWGYSSSIALAIFALAGTSIMFESLELTVRDDRGNKSKAASSAGR